MTRTSCSEAQGEPFLLVAIGTSESAGPGEYPELYADMLCEQLGVPVELHGFYPTIEGLTPLAWWIEQVSTSEEIQADLAAADEVVMWAMSSHDIVRAQFWPGACRGAWPDPLRACLEEKLGHVPAQNDELFGLIAGFVRDDVPVLVSDAYAPPVVMTMPWWDEPHADDIKRMVDPYYVVEPAAAKWGFTFVDTELVFNGESRRDPPPEGLFQSDGLHPSPAGAALIAQTYAAADPFWALVGISDSRIWDAPGGSGHEYARMIETDLDVNVSVRWFFYGGSTSGFVLNKIRSDGALREAVGSADVIVFDVPVGALGELCPTDWEAYQPAPGSPEEYRQCQAEVAAGFADDAEAIMVEIDSLRRPDALVRTLNTWVLFYGLFGEMGLRDVVVGGFRTLNGALQDAADAHGIPVADAFGAFMGADGTTDPVAAGYVDDDQVHATPAGHRRVAELWRDMGYGR